MDKGGSAAAASEEEHILLSSDELESVEPSHIGAVLEQMCHSRASRRRFYLFNRTYLGVRIQRYRSRVEDYWINLAFLDPKPLRVRRFDRLWWSVTALMGLLTAVLIAVFAALDGAPAVSRWIVTVPLAASATLVSLWIALYRSYDKLIFCTRHGRVQVLELFRNKPSRKALDRFVTELIARIQEAVSERAASRTHYLRDEMKEHRRLAQQGVLSAVDFERAKRRVLHQHG